MQIFRPVDLRIRAAYARILTKRIVRETHTLTIRMLLAASSFGAALVILGYELFGRGLFARHGYEVMQIFGNEWVWAGAFLMHFAGVVWRVYEPRSRPAWGFAVNALGVALWAVKSFSVAWALKAVTLATPMELAVCCFALWVLFRTDAQEEEFSP